MRIANRAGGVVLGVFAVPVGLAGGVLFAGGINLHYSFNTSWFVAALVLGAVACSLGASSLLLFGVRPRRAWAIAGLVLAAWTVGFVVDQWLTFPSPATEADRDRPALRAVPVYPGSKFAGERVAGELPGDSTEGFLTPAVDVRTSWTWRSPHGVPVRSIADWYEQRLRAGGVHVSRGRPGNVGAVELDFVEDGRTVSLVVYPAYAHEIVRGHVEGWPAEVVATAGPGG